MVSVCIYVYASVMQHAGASDLASKRCAGASDLASHKKPALNTLPQRVFIIKYADRVKMDSRSEFYRLSSRRTLVGEGMRLTKYQPREASRRKPNNRIEEK